MTRFASRLRLVHLAAIAAIATSAIGCAASNEQPPASSTASNGQPPATEQTAPGQAPGQAPVQAPGQAPGQAPAPAAPPQAAAPPQTPAAPAPVAVDMAPIAGYLTSQDPNARINIRQAPTTSAATPHYGVQGDSVTLLQYADASDGYIWYYVSFDASGSTGWVRGDFVATEGVPAANNSAPAAGASGVVETVQFAPGASAATMYNSVVRGTQDTYYLSYGTNQYLSASLGSTESNAVFQLYVNSEGEWVALDGALPGQDATSWYGLLPYDAGNELMVIVSPTRGNAEYELYLGIE